MIPRYRQGLGALFWPEDTPAKIMREQRRGARHGRGGVWVSQAAERGGCRVSFVSVETPCFSGGWLSPQCYAQPTEGFVSLGWGGAGDPGFVHEGRDLCAGRAGKLRLPPPEQSGHPQTLAQTPELSPARTKPLLCSLHL